MLRPYPPKSADDQPFWDFCSKGELRVQRCKSCGKYLWPVAPACPDDYSEDLEWTKVSDTGTISSWVVYHRVYDREFAQEVPYVCVNVELPEGIRFSGNVFAANGSFRAADVLGSNKATDALNGRKVKLFFERLDDGLMIPQWKLLDDNDKS